MDGISPRPAPRRMRLAAAPILLLGLLCQATGTFAQEYRPPELILTAKVRDFKEKNPSDTVGTHPHFNTVNACNALEAGAPTVKTALDTAQATDGGFFPGDNRGPALADSMPENLARCFEPRDRFGDWFQDKGDGVNRAYLTELRFVLDSATGLYAWNSDSFFPLDAGTPRVKIRPTDAEPFGHLQTAVVDGVDLSRHNYGFTMEFHSRITYAHGAGQSLTFKGDDDIWVFIAGRKVVDLGGVHQTQSHDVKLDSLAAVIPLENGANYPLDFFFAERHTASSSCRITASLHIPSAIPVAAAPVAGSASTDPAGITTVTLGSETPGASIYYTLDGSQPDSAKTPYTGAVAVPAGAVLKAITYRPGWRPSAILEASYASGTPVRRGPGLPLGALARSGEVDIFDHAGKRVRTLRAGTEGGWDGRDSRGRPAAPGVYFWKPKASRAAGMAVLP